VGQFENQRVMSQLEKLNQPSLFVGGDIDVPAGTDLPEGVVLIHRAFDSAAILDAINMVVAAAPFRHMETPGGKRMSVAMSNCGSVGWVSTRAGYAYSPIDPETKQAWPAMPALLHETATQLAQRAGYPHFAPDACLINRYQHSAQMGLHQDRDEKDFSQPIVSLSLGLPAKFMIGGLRRSDTTRSIDLIDGDAIIFGGAARLMFHGVRPLKAGHHPVFGDTRINLTFRVAGTT
jgi:DNA oxidative demethylase